MTWPRGRDLSRDETIELSNRVLKLPERRVSRSERIFEVDVAGMGWTVGGEFFESDGQPLTVSDGRKVGVFLLHGGGGDHRQMANLADLLTARFGIKSYSFSYPGHINLSNQDRRWPGEPLDDGTGKPRVPHWHLDAPIEEDEYDLVVHEGDPDRRRTYGTSFLLRARQGTAFFARQAVWPLAYETAYIEACRKEFPEDEYVVFLHGHSTGGPQVHMLLQRLPNVGGLLGLETSPFGEVMRQMHPPSLMDWEIPFQDLAMRTWRDTARYVGTESGLVVADLPYLMELVMEQWEVERERPGFKAEHLIQMAQVDALTEAAKTAALLMGLDDEATDSLIARYRGYVAPIAGRRIPPLFYMTNRFSRDHRADNYLGSLLPVLDRLEFPPKVEYTRLGAGIHNYNRPEEDLPRGTAPAAVGLWVGAIREGFFDDA